MRCARRRCLSFRKHILEDVRALAAPSKDNMETLALDTDSRYDRLSSLREYFAFPCDVPITGLGPRHTNQ